MMLSREHHTGAASTFWPDAQIWWERIFLDGVVLCRDVDLGERRDYPQGKPKKETALAKKVADSGRFGRWLPAARMTATPRPAGIGAKKKGLETIQALLIGGGGGSRTRVRQSSAVGSTCLVGLLCLTRRCPANRACDGRSRLGFNESAPVELHRDLVRYDAWGLDAQARLQSDGTLLGIKQRVRSCRRWQLRFAIFDLRDLSPSRHAPRVL